MCLEIVYFLWWLTVPEYNSELSSISVSLWERRPPSPEEIVEKKNFFMEVKVKSKGLMRCIEFKGNEVFTVYSHDIFLEKLVLGWWICCSNVGNILLF